MSAFDDENSIAAKHAEDDGDERYHARERARHRVLMDRANFCPKCGGDPQEEKDYVGWIISCADCYDGAEDSGPRAIAHGATLLLAVAAWNELDIGPTVTMVPR